MSPHTQAELIDRFVKGLPHRQRRGLAAMLRSYPAPVTREMLADAIWGDDPEGGPGDIAHCIADVVRGLRNRLPGAVVNVGKNRGWTLNLEGIYE